MKLGDKNAKEAFETHLVHLIPTEPASVWSFIRPDDKDADRFPEKLKDWSAQLLDEEQQDTPRRPVNQNELVELRWRYLDLLDAYEMFCETMPKFPHDVYTKAQIDKTRALLDTPSDLGNDARLKLISGWLDQYNYRKSAGDTTYKICGFTRRIAAQALIYWCLTEDA